MIAPIAEDMNNANDPPALQFMKTIADVRAGDCEGGGNLLCRQWAWRKKKEGVDLGDGAIDPPARSHFAPMENELLGNGRKMASTHLLFLSKQKLENIGSYSQEKCCGHGRNGSQKDANAGNCAACLYRAPSRTARLLDALRVISCVG